MSDVPVPAAEIVITGEPPELAAHCWLEPPLQVHSSTGAPLAVPAPVTSRHSPDWTPVMVPLALTCHCWLTGRCRSRSPPWCRRGPVAVGVKAQLAAAAVDGELAGGVWSSLVGPAAAVPDVQLGARGGAGAGHVQAPARTHGVHLPVFPPRRGRPWPRRPAPSDDHRHCRPRPPRAAAAAPPRPPRGHPRRPKTDRSQDRHLPTCHVNAHNISWCPAEVAGPPATMRPSSASPGQPGQETSHTHVADSPSRRPPPARPCAGSARGARHAAGKFQPPRLSFRIMSMAGRWPGTGAG